MVVKKSVVVAVMDMRIEKSI